VGTKELAPSEAATLAGGKEEHVQVHAQI